LLFGALSVTGVLYGLTVYYGLSSAQTEYAGKEFKSLAAQAGQDIRKVLPTIEYPVTDYTDYYTNTLLLHYYTTITLIITIIRVSGY
jgi:hypothetical protein